MVRMEHKRLAKALSENYPEHVAEPVFALNTGLRMSSQYGATYEMIDWAQNVLGLPRTKNVAIRYEHLAPGQLHEDVGRLAWNSTPSSTDAEPRHEGICCLQKSSTLGA